MSKSNPTVCSNYSKQAKMLKIPPSTIILPKLVPDSEMPAFVDCEPELPVGVGEPDEDLPVAVEEDWLPEAVPEVPAELEDEVEPAGTAAATLATGVQDALEFVAASPSLYGKNETAPLLSICTRAGMEAA